jgi:transcriptional antiterminator RfaH
MTIGRGTVIMKWYVVSAKPRQEKIAAQNLARLGVEPFFPQIRRNRRGVRGVNRSVSPLFPGYLFARFDRVTHYRAVNFAQGVRKVVMFGSTLAEVEAEMIESIRSKLTDGILTVAPPSFHPGQSVRIEEGPLKGLEAVFEREMDDRERVVVLLKAISYQARVVVNLDSVANL